MSRGQPVTTFSFVNSNSEQNRPSSSTQKSNDNSTQRSNDNEEVVEEDNLENTSDDTQLEKTADKSKSTEAVSLSASELANSAVPTTSTNNTKKTKF